MYDGLDSKLDINVIMLSLMMLAVVNGTSQQAGHVKCVAKPCFFCSDFASRYSTIC